MAIVEARLRIGHMAVSAANSDANACKAAVVNLANDATELSQRLSLESELASMDELIRWNGRDRLRDYKETTDVMALYLAALTLSVLTLVRDERRERAKLRSREVRRRAERAVRRAEQKRELDEFVTTRRPSKGILSWTKSPNSGKERRRRIT